MIGEILPSVAAAAESFGDLDDAAILAVGPADRPRNGTLPGVCGEPCPAGSGLWPQAGGRFPVRGGLFPGEEAALATAAAARRAEFTLGRACARAALAGLGVPPAQILPGRAGEPRWPPGVVGSITHCAGYQACAVARTSELAAIGVDAEPARVLPAGLLAAVASAAELGWLRMRAAVSPAVPWDRLLFCAKEAAYKAWFPLTGQRPGLDDMTVTASLADSDRPAGTFTIRLPSGSRGQQSSPWPGRLAGRWLISKGLILAAVAVREPDRDDGSQAAYRAGP